MQRVKLTTRPACLITFRADVHPAGRTTTGTSLFTM
jgi:hypothetical protein